MPDQHPTPDPAERARHTELEILYLLTQPDDSPALWSLEELERELNPLEVDNAVTSLLGAGLLHCTADGFLFASRAAVRQIQLVGHGVV